MWRYYWVNMKAWKTYKYVEMLFDGDGNPHMLLQDLRQGELTVISIDEEGCNEYENGRHIPPLLVGAST